MHELYEIRDKLTDELKDIGKNGITSGSLEKIDTLAHSIKNIDKIIECDEDGYSGRAYPDYHRSYRGRMRDGMGRYSGHADDKESIRREIRELEDRLNKM